MVIYPRAGHGPNEPRQILDVMRRNLDWFDRWLKEKP
jgi:dipeptidyl aminopeptidase/acylaminoacyl peptidase